VRRSVLARAGYRCEAPGCTNPYAIELHHLVPFADGGPHTKENLRVWCHRCHELWHRSLASGLDES
jgi:5-methylcytosine-specific restriction endonuclease McrA